MPEQDAVVVVTSGLKDMQAVLNLIWDKLLPAMKGESLPANSEDQNKLKNKLAGLTVPTLQGSATSGLLEQIGGKQYVFPTNDQKIEWMGLEMSKADRQTTLVVKSNGGTEQKIACGNGVWHKGRIAYGAFSEQTVAACGAWMADDKYVVKLCFYETPFILTLNLTLSGNKLALETKRNVGFGPLSPKQLVGESK